MKGLLYTLLLTSLVFAAGACTAAETGEDTGAAAADATPAPTPSTPMASSAPAAAAPPAERPAAPAPPPAPARPRMFEVPAGTEVSVILTDSLSSGTNQAGDQFVASLAAPLVIGGQTVIERGAKVHGRVIDAEGSGRVKGRANMRLALTSIVDGTKSYPIVTKPFVAEAEATKGRDAGIIGGAAGIGAAIGAIAGGKKGAATGAAIGGGAGAGTVLATKGQEVEFKSESKLTFTLDRAAELPVIKRIS